MAACLLSLNNTINDGVTTDLDMFRVFARCVDVLVCWCGMFVCWVVGLIMWWWWWWYT